MLHPTIRIIRKLMQRIKKVYGRRTTIDNIAIELSRSSKSYRKTSLRTSFVMKVELYQLFVQSHDGQPLNWGFFEELNMITPRTGYLTQPSSISAQSNLKKSQFLIGQSCLCYHLLIAAKLHLHVKFGAALWLIFRILFLPIKHCF